jgi:predicted HTH transcriptional regulator
MTNHDSKQQAFDAQQLLTDINAVKRISPEFSDMSLDLQEIMKESSNPAFLAALFYKLTKEREETNKILKGLEQKFEKIQEVLLTSSSNSHTNLEETILSEPDQHIMLLVEELGQVSAQDVRTRLAYRKSNAASQRLSKLVREGHLKRIRSGRRVLFVRQHPTQSTVL